MCCLNVHFQTLATLARPWECSTRTVHTADRGGHSIGFYHSDAGVGVYVHLYQGKIRREYTGGSCASCGQGGQLEHELEHCAGAAFYHRGVSL